MFKIMFELIKEETVLKDKILLWFLNLIIILGFVLCFLLIFDDFIVSKIIGLMGLIAYVFIEGYAWATDF